MTPSRRGFFGLLAGAAAAPIVAKLPAPVASPYAWTEVSAGYTVTNLSLQDIVTATLRARSGVLLDNMTRNNALLERLTARR